MELPEWVIDKVLPQRRHAATMLIIALFRFGSAVFIDGARRVYLKLPRGQHKESDSLASRALISKRALDLAIADLVAARLLLVHRANRSDRADGYSFPVDEPDWLAGMQNPHPSQIRRDAKPASLPDSASRAHTRSEEEAKPPDLLLSVGEILEDDPSASSDPRAGAIARVVALLIELEVSRPQELVRRFGLEACCGALVDLDHDVAQGVDVARPGGRLFSALMQGTGGQWEDVELVLAAGPGFARPRRTGPAWQGHPREWDWRNALGELQRKAAYVDQTMSFYEAAEQLPFEEWLAAQASEAKR